MVSVHALSSSVARWTFDRPWISTTDIFGLQIGSQGPFDVSGDGTTHMDVTYPDSIAAGDPWEVLPASVTIVFNPLGDLHHQTGTVT